MHWWLIPMAIGVVALLWFLWVAAFHPGETVSAMPELDGYVPGTHAAETRNGTEEALRTEEGLVAEAPSEPQQTNGPGSKSDELGDELRGVVGGGAVADRASDDDGGTWIELDITPLFPSSESRQIVDLAEIEDPEVTS